MGRRKVFPGRNGALAALAWVSIVCVPATIAAQEAPKWDRTVTATGTGRVEREPDRAVLILAVETFAETAQEAAAQNAERTGAVLDALRRMGLSGDDIRTQGYQLHPEYQYDQPGPRQRGRQRLVGYRAINRIEATVDEIDRVGEVIDGAIAAGANRMDWLSFRLRDRDAARREALREAVANARLEAEAIAAALGMRLGPVLSVSTTGSFPRPAATTLEARAIDAVAAATPIEPGTLEVTAMVTTVFQLEPR